MIAESDREENRRSLKGLRRIAERRANKRSLAARTGHVAANWWQSAAFCGFAARSLVRKIVSTEALERCSASKARSSVQIRTRVQSLAMHATAARSTGDESFGMNSGIPEST
jgi:hypothetical protein